MKHIQDEKLVNLCIIKAPGAWEELTQRYEKYITAIIRKKLGYFRIQFNEQDIEEIRENVYNALIENNFYLLRKYNSKYPLAVYLGVITATQCNRFVRKKKIPLVSLDTSDSQNDSDRKPHEMVADRASGPAEETENSDLSDKIKTAMEKLKPRDKLVITMFYFDAMSYRDIGKALRLRENNVGKAVFRAKMQLKKELKKLNITEELP